MTSLRVAAAQIASGSDPADNLRLVQEYAARAADQGADLVVFPEATMARFGSKLRDVAEPLDGRFADGVRGVAEQRGIALVVGMFTPADDGRVRNTLLVTGRGVEARYDKIHLFDAFGTKESDVVAPGTGLVTFDLGDARVGLATCYDVRFADQFTALGRAGAQVVALPASWADGSGKAEQWDVLVRARAMDAQAWLVASGQAWVLPEKGQPLGVGRSAVVDPLGGVRARLDGAPGLLVADVDLDVVADVRRRVPVLGADQAEG